MESATDGATGAQRCRGSRNIKVSVTAKACAVRSNERTEAQLVSSAKGIEQDSELPHIEILVYFNAHLYVCKPLNARSQDPVYLWRGGKRHENR